MIPKKKPKKKITMAICLRLESEYNSPKKSLGSFVEVDSSKDIVETFISFVLSSELLLWFSILSWSTNPGKGYLLIESWSAYLIDLKFSYGELNKNLNR